MISFCLKIYATASAAHVSDALPRNSGSGSRSPVPGNPAGAATHEPAFAEHGLTRRARA